MSGPARGRGALALAAVLAVLATIWSLERARTTSVVGRRALARAAPEPRGAAALGGLREGATRPWRRVPLGINRSRSSLTESELRATLAEVNRIWAQAGICFEARDIRHGFGTRPPLVLWFVAEDEPFVSGYYQNDWFIWAEETPKLGRAPHPAAIARARTAAHELGHALGLRHLPRSGDWIDGLMNTGFDGYALAPFEIRAAREKAAEVGLAALRERCLEPWL